MGKGIWDRVYGKGRKKKLDEMEQKAVGKKPKKAAPKKKKSPEQAVRDSFWGD
jgi:hypothetical protein